MSYLYQNYFNNFQIRNPVLKNPVGFNTPLQLTKVRPADLGTSSVTMTTENLNCAALRVNPNTGAAVTYTLPAANEIITWLGVQQNGLPTPYFSNSVQTGDVLVIPVINQGTGCTITAGTGGSGSLALTGSNAFAGNINNLVIDFDNVSSGPGGVTGSYVVYGCSC